MAGRDALSTPQSAAAQRRMRASAQRAGNREGPAIPWGSVCRGARRAQSFCGSDAVSDRGSRQLGFSSVSTPPRCSAQKQALALVGSEDQMVLSVCLSQQQNGR